MTLCKNLRSSGAFLLVFPRGAELVKMSDIPLPAPEPVIHRIWNQTWPQAIIGFGLALTIIWIFILGRGLVELSKMILELAMA